MTQQYGRQVSLVVGTKGGDGLDLSQMQIKFETHRGDYQTPNWCIVRIYNLSTDTVKALQVKEYSQLTLKAGYEGNFGIIFQGTIKYKYRGHESNVDSYLDLVAADGDSAYNFAVVNTTLAAGSTAQTQLAALAKATDAYGVGLAPYQPPLNTTKLPRGKVMFGPAKDKMRILAANNGASWSIQDGKMQLILQTSYLPGAPVKLTSDTGLTGFPVETLNGLIVRALLNPSIKIGTAIQIDNASIQQFHLDVSIQSDIQQQFLNQMKNDDGLYKVLIAEHSGNTRGNDFYTQLTCIGINGSIPPSSPLFTKSSVAPYGP